MHAFPVAKKRKKQKKHRSPDRAAARHPPESRAAEAITIMWSLCMLATTVALGVMLVTKAIGRSIPTSSDALQLIHLLPDLLLFMASVTGTLCMVLIWPTHKLRKTRPPLTVTLYAVGISIAPLLIVLGNSWMGR